MTENKEELILPNKDTIPESKGVKLFGNECLITKAKEIEDYIAKLLFLKVAEMSYGEYKSLIRQEASKLINNIIIPTQDEPYWYFWEGVDEKINPDKYRIANNE